MVKGRGVFKSDQFSAFDSFNHCEFSSEQGVHAIFGYPEFILIFTLDERVFEFCANSDGNIARDCPGGGGPDEEKLAITVNDGEFEID